LSLPARFTQSLEIARSVVAQNGYQDICDFPCVPEAGAHEEELAQLESEIGRPLPAEYREFLKLCRYLKIDDGCEVGGLSHNGVSVTERPWVSDEHRADVTYLVFANYWRFADGDQLMFDLSDESFPVVAYLHEHGPLYEAYAPSFSLALWRLVHEAEQDLE
jgi:hypothetical protein